MKRAIGFVFAALLLMGASRAANASGWGYVCDMADYPLSNGNYGSLFIGVYTGPGCTGTYVGSGYLCSTGTSSNSCSSLLRDEAQLVGLANRLQQAMLQSEKVYYSADSNGNPLNTFFYAAGF